MADLLNELKNKYANKGNSKISLNSKDFDDTRDSAIKDGCVDQFHEESSFSFEVINGHVLVFRKD